MPIIPIIDKAIFLIGRSLAFVCLLMMLITSVNVALRYVFNINYIAMQESISYLHAMVFLLGISYAMQYDAHVRVDIFYQHFTQRQKAWVNSLGILVFVLPFCGLLATLGWSFFLDSWAYRESSPEPGGLPFVYILKLLIPLMAACVFLQALSLLLKSSRVLIDNEVAD